LTTRFYYDTLKKLPRGILRIMTTEKDYRKILVNLGKDLVEYGLTCGAGGNISIKRGNSIYIKASGTWFDKAKSRDYLKVPLEGDKDKKGVRLKPSCELRMHRACYKVRKDINCVIHSHPVYSIIFANKYRKLKAVTAEFAAILETDIPVIEYIDPGSFELANEVADKILLHNGLILANHGVITVGDSPREALYRNLLIENESKIILFSDLFSKAKYLNYETKKKIVSSVYSEYRRRRLKG